MSEIDLGPRPAPGRRLSRSGLTGRSHGALVGGHLCLRHARRDRQYMCGRFVPPRRLEALLYVEFALCQCARNAHIAVDLVRPLVDVPWVSILGEFLTRFRQRTLIAAQTEFAAAKRFGNR